MNVTNQYVERQDGDCRIKNSRINLASVIYCWQEGLSPESIRDEFPALTLEQVYGAITYYLHNQTEIDAYLKSLAADFATRADQEAKAYPEITAKLRTTAEMSKR